MPSEFELITRYFSRPVPSDMLGAGDDCALFPVKPGMQLATSTDLLLEGRTRYQAPEVDGCVYINAGIASPGDIVSVHITDAQVYDLIGEIVERLPPGA